MESIPDFIFSCLFLALEDGFKFTSRLLTTLQFPKGTQSIGSKMLTNDLTCCQVMLNNDARNTAWVSFDGRNQQELRVGDRSV